jgi:hypothetical protein
VAVAASVPSDCSLELASSRICDRFAIVALCVVTLVALLTFRDYGLSWDDYTHAQYGDLLLKYYASGLRDQRALHWVNLYYYGGGFDLLAALLAKLLPFTVFETRRLLGALVGILGLLVTWRVGRRIAGPLAGLVTLLLLAACPLYFGHMFINPKDTPFAVAMAILLFALVRAFQEYPQASAATILLLGVGVGLSFGSRILAGFGALDGFAALALVVAIDANANGMRPALSRMGSFALRMVPALLLAYAIMAVVWPWALLDPLNPLRAAEYFSRFFEKPWQELFGGDLIRVPDMPRSYVPMLLALKLPELFLLLGFGGAAGALVASFNRRLPINERAVLLLVVLAAALPPLVAILLRPAMYNGVRHFLFVLPPLAVLGGLAGTYITVVCARWSSVALIAAAAVFVTGVVLPSIEMARLHPYEYTHFNRLAGGIAHARDQYMLDYWGLSLKQASRALLSHIHEERIVKPSGRPWRVAVCGPHRSPQVELGPDFETTWDPQGADFAIMLGEFYCARLDAPLIAEIAREGVGYAWVYDIRGRSFTTLLTQPGL